MNGIGGIKPTTNVPSNTESYQIISVNDENVSRWQDVRIEILNNVMNDQVILLTLMDSDNNKIKYPLIYNPSILNNEGDIIQNIGLNVVYPNNEAIIGTVSNKQNNSNIKIGDKITSINEVPINSWTEFVKFIHNNPNKLINIKAERDDELVEYTANILAKNNIGFLGVSKRNDLSQFVKVSYDFKDSFSKALNSTTDYTLLTFKMIGRLVVGDANVKNLSGPLSIAQFSGRSLEMGLSYFLYLLAILSVSLGVLNLLPIPMLDGGHLVYYTYEMIT